ncbi:MAG: aspartate kinase [Clostridiales bacterium]|nr:aspartate kinase [Clostridiales bacterium]
MLKVLKFGGSSVADAAHFKRIKSIVESDSARSVVVVSAPGKMNGTGHKVTDLLYLCHAHIKYGVSFDEIFRQVEERYLNIKKGCGLQTDIESELAALKERMREGLSEDELVSRGEYFTAKLMADFLGFAFLDAALWLKFSYDGKIDLKKSYDALSKLAAGRKVVIPGFYGVMPDGKIKTLTRGGSDVTGALAAAALDADVYENWTDVSGILMADPRIVKDPRPIERATYSELRELSYIGAKVLHEDAVFPVKDKGIPLNIRNIDDPDSPGTLILDEICDENGEASPQEGNFITGIAGRKGYTVITISKPGMSSTPGVLLNMLQILAAHDVNVEYLPNGIDCASFVVSTEKLGGGLYSILGEVEKQIEPTDIKITENMAVVAAVGRKMAFRPGISAKLFGVLGDNGVNIRMITQGPEELNIIVGVEEKDFEQAIRALYESCI